LSSSNMGGGGKCDVEQQQHGGWWQVGCSSAARCRKHDALHGFASLKPTRAALCFAASRRQ
jgi:hypothetical protein